MATAAQVADADGVPLSTVCADNRNHFPPPRGFGFVDRAVPAPAPGCEPRCAAAMSASRTPVFSPDDVVADLAGSGLVIARAELVGRTVITADGDRPAIDALVRADRRTGR